MENTNAYLDPQQFLESKYSESFRPYSMITDSIDQPYIEYFFIADSNPNVFNRVIYDGIDFYDDYFGTLIKEEYLQIVSSIINQFDKTAKCFADFKARSFPNDFCSKNMLYIMLRKMKKKLAANIYVFINKSSKFNVETIEEIKDLLELNQLTGNLYICIIQGPLSNINNDNYKNFISNPSYSIKIN